MGKELIIKDDVELKEGYEGVIPLEKRFYRGREINHKLVGYNHLTKVLSKNHRFLDLNGWLETNPGEPLFELVVSDSRPSHTIWSVGLRIKLDNDNIELIHSKGLLYDTKAIDVSDQNQGLKRVLFASDLIEHNSKTIFRYQ